MKRRYVTAQNPSYRAQDQSIFELIKTITPRHRTPKNFPHEGINTFPGEY